MWKNSGGERGHAALRHVFFFFNTEQTVEENGVEGPKASENRSTLGGKIQLG